MESWQQDEPETTLEERIDRQAGYFRRKWLKKEWEEIGREESRQI